MNGVTVVILVFLGFGIFAMLAGFAMGYAFGSPWPRTKAEKISDGWAQAWIMLISTWGVALAAWGFVYLLTSAAA